MSRRPRARLAAGEGALPMVPVGPLASVEQAARR
jgi:hypothetical protein